MADDREPAPESRPSWRMDSVAQALLQLLVKGELSPLRGFMARADADAVNALATLADDTKWPVPVLLTVDEATASRCPAGASIELVDDELVRQAELQVQDRWQDDDGWHLGGPVTTLLPDNDQPAERDAAEGKKLLAVPVVRPLTVAELDELCRLAQSVDQRLLLTPLTGPGWPVAASDLMAMTVAAAQATEGRAVVRELTVPALSTGHTAFLHAVAAHHHGATDIVPLVPTEAETIGPLRVIDHQLDRTDDVVVLLRDEQRWPPGWLYPQVEAAVRQWLRPRSQRGLVVFFTGLSGSGKSTIAQVVARTIEKRHGRPVTLLDGDHVRTLLSAGLTFSRADRDLNIRRIGWVAAQINRHGGVAICAPIAPHDAARQAARAMVAEAGGEFVLIHVSTPLVTCEARDRKGLYAKARAGLIPNFTGVSEPYEAPSDADLAVDTSNITIQDAVQRVVDLLISRGYLKPIQPAR